MNARFLWNRAAWYFAMAAASSISPAVAQQAAPVKEEKPSESVTLDKFIVTGSLIKRIAGESALPVQTITLQEIDQLGINGPEELLMTLNINGNGLDNLASNADVVTGAARGNNGATSANLRGQGAGATLVLLNGRRVASHGLSGGVVDLNSIPFAAIERVETLKDGASATYGTDAVGGVINFILKTNFRGLVANASTDITEQGGGNVHRYSLLAGVGDLNRDKFNLMTSLRCPTTSGCAATSATSSIRSSPTAAFRSTPRGTPIATIFPLTTLYTAISRDKPRQRRPQHRSRRPAEPGRAHERRHQHRRPACWSGLCRSRRHGPLRRTALVHADREIRLRLGHRAGRRATAAGAQLQPRHARHGQAR